MPFLPRPQWKGNPSNELWQEWANSVSANLNQMNHRPSTADELDDFMDNLPRRWGIGQQSIVYTHNWLHDYLDIQ